MPPKTASVESPVWLPSTSASARICATSSRVGATTSARGPRRPGAPLFNRREKIVIRKAAVLPVPVCASPTTSEPDISAGMVAAWMAVGDS
jgi:hypothetical protein